MIALDTNILAYALVSSQPEHAAANTWLQRNTWPLVTTGINIGETLRLLTHPRIFPRPLTSSVAIHTLRQFCEAWQVRQIQEADTWLEDLATLLHTLPDIRGNELFDTRIALCLQHHGVKRLCTNDSDFVKYPFLTLQQI